MNMKLADLRIDPEFENALPKLTNSEYETLDRSIASKGFDESFPIVIWKGKNIIVEGHNRYKICKFRGIEEVPVIEKEFESREEVLAWIYRTQLARRNLSGDQYKYYVGKRYEAEKAARGGSKSRERDSETGKFTSKPQNGEMRKAESTSQRIAAEIGKSKNYVERAEQFAKGLDAAEEIDPNIKEDVFSGKVKAPAKVISKIATATPEEKKELVNEIRNPKKKEKGGKDDVGATVLTEDQQGTRKCSKCGRVKPTSYFSISHGYTTSVCKECEAERKREQREKELGSSKIGKIISMLKDDERDISNSKEDTKNELVFLIEGFKSSLESILENDYDKSDIEKVFVEHIEYLKRKKGEL